MRHAWNEEQATVGQAMASDHLALERLFDRVMTSLRTGDGERIRQCWLELDGALERHLEAEEALILPPFAQAHPEHGARLCREHRAIRAALLDLGVDLDLHSLSAGSASRFIALLRRHAAFEDCVVYPWAQHNLSEASKLSLLERVQSRVQRSAAGSLRALGMHDGKDAP